MHYLLILYMHVFWSYYCGSCYFELCGLFQRKDIAVAGISITYERNQVVDFVHEHTQDTTGLVFQMVTDKETYFIDSFQTNVWGLLFCLFIVTLVLYMMSEVCNPNTILSTDRTRMALALFGNMLGQG